jgi:hypothetical protein
VPVTVNGVTYDIDLGVQMIAPSAYPAVLSMLALPEFKSVALQDVTLQVACSFPPVSGTTPYWGNLPAYQDTPLWNAGKADCATFQTLLANASDPTDTLDQFLQANAGKFQNLSQFENDRDLRRLAPQADRFAFANAHAIATPLAPPPTMQIDCAMRSPIM